MIQFYLNNCRSGLFRIKHSYSRLLSGLSLRITHDDKLLTPEERLLKKYENDIFHSDYLEERSLNLGFRAKAAAITKYNKSIIRKREEDSLVEPLPLSLKYLGYEPPKKPDTENEIPKDSPQASDANDSVIQFPFDNKSTVAINSDETFSININDKTDKRPSVTLDYAKEFNREIRTRLELLNKNSDHLKWMQDYESFPKFSEEEEAEEINLNDEMLVNYGTPDPNSEISKFPCRGCGALLHCKDPAIPGYLPSEIFKNAKKKHDNPLDRLSCQRCHFLKTYNMALQVRVSPEDYPKVLHTISQYEKALVVLMVDLLDFPSSIWPGIMDLIGYNKPIVVVGNKVDLLPNDGKGFLQRVEDNLRNSMKENGFATTNLKHVCLVSAKTGFGVEDLITKLHRLWQYKGDVFLVGCTNVGKSTLFNLLLNSDYCRHTAANLIERATTSLWPGTTLNLLKFPINRVSGWRLHVRAKRLQSLKKLEAEERRLNMENAKNSRTFYRQTLMGHIEPTFNADDHDQYEDKDVHNINAHRNPSMGVMSAEEVEQKFATSKNCYDTPGVVQPGQIIHLLTTDELVNTLPSEMITPRTFSVQPGMSVLIGGLARLDCLETAGTVKFTVYRSNKLPITICSTSKVDEIYECFLHTEILKVPMNHKERLKLWPPLKLARFFRISGVDRDFAANDVVLSNAGWVAVTPDCGQSCTVQGWTPEGRGIFLRDSLLPYSVKYRGKKIRRTCAYVN